MLTTNGGAAASVSVSGTVATDGVGNAESVAPRVKANDPDTVGVPYRSPELLSVNPAGIDPEVTDHVYGPMPPVAPNEA